MQCHSVYTGGMRRPLPLRRFVVYDTSMRPVLQPGDRLLVWQWGRRPKTGDVVVLRDPELHRTFAVKRVAQVEPNGDFIVHADNPNVSRDSRSLRVSCPLGRVLESVVVMTKDSLFGRECW